MTNASLQGGRSESCCETGDASSPPQTGASNPSTELGIHIVTLYNLRKAWRLQGEVVPAPEKDPGGWSAVDKFEGGPRDRWS